MSNLQPMHGGSFGFRIASSPPYVQELLEDPKNFAIVILGLLVIYNITADIFDLYPTPA